MLETNACQQNVHMLVSSQVGNLVTVALHPLMVDKELTGDVRAAPAVVKDGGSSGQPP